MISGTMRLRSEKEVYGSDSDEESHKNKDQTWKEVSVCGDGMCASAE